MPIAADYPLLNAFWTMLLFFLFVAWIWTLVIVLTDVFSNHSTSGWVKAAWTLFMIVLPFLGVLVYLIAEGSNMAERRMKDVEASQAQLDSHIRQVAGTGAAGEIGHAKDLLDRGAITQAEYEQLKRNALAGGAAPSGDYAVH